MIRRIIVGSLAFGAVEAASKFRDYNERDDVDTTPPLPVPDSSISSQCHTPVQEEEKMVEKVLSLPGERQSESDEVIVLDSQPKYTAKQRRKQAAKRRKSIFIHLESYLLSIYRTGRSTNLSAEAKIQTMIEDYHSSLKFKINQEKLPENIKHNLRFIHRNDSCEGLREACTQYFPGCDVAMTVLNDLLDSSTFHTKSSPNARPVSGQKTRKSRKRHRQKRILSFSKQKTKVLEEIIHSAANYITLEDMQTKMRMNVQDDLDRKKFTMKNSLRNLKTTIKQIFLHKFGKVCGERLLSLATREELVKASSKHGLGNKMLFKLYEFAGIKDVPSTAVYFSKPRPLTKRE